MSPSLAVRDTGLAAVRRLRGAWWPITQTSVAAGLAWYLAHDVLAHRQPFFAPVCAAVCLSASNLLRTQRALQTIVGVALGISLAAAMQGLLGGGPIAIGLAVFTALCVAVLIGHGYFAGVTFHSQAAISAILVLAFARSGVVLERLFDALIGGGLALVCSILLFPTNPLTVLRDARAGVWAALNDILALIADTICDRTPVAPGWPPVDRLHQKAAQLTEARATARQVVRVAPLRWAARDTVRDADQQAAHLALLASSVLHLARTVMAALDISDWLPQPLHAAIGDLATGTALATSDPTAAAEHAAAARHHASALLSAARNRREVVLAAVVRTCVEDLQQVIDFAQR